MRGLRLEHCTIINSTYNALDIASLGLTAGATGAMLMFCMNGHILDTGRLTGVYGIDS